MVRRVLRCTRPACNFVVGVESTNKESASILLAYGSVNKILGKPYEMCCPKCGRTLQADDKLVVKLR